VVKFILFLNKLLGESLGEIRRLIAAGSLIKPGKRDFPLALKSRSAARVFLILGKAPAIPLLCPLSIYRN
jgi:hypothetical protein